MPTIPLRSHIETLQVEVAKKGGSSDLVLHGAALTGALNLTNGHRGNIESMSDQLALLTAVLVGDRLTEKARHLGECVLTPQIHTNPDGTPNYPWPSRKEVVDLVSELRAEDVKRATEAKTIGSTLRFSLRDGISATGAVAYLTLVLVAIGGMLYLWSGQRDKAIERAVSNAVSVQIRGVMTSAANAGRSADAKADWDSNKE